MSSLLFTAIPSKIEFLCKKPNDRLAILSTRNLSRILRVQGLKKSSLRTICV